VNVEPKEGDSREDRLLLWPKNIGAPTKVQPQAKASAEANPKLSYRDEDKKILESCIRRARSGGGRGERNVIWGWGDLAGRPEPMTREVQEGFLSRKERRVLRRSGKFF
jgi:hypothetical protein